MQVMAEESEIVLNHERVRFEIVIEIFIMLILKVVVKCSLNFVFFHLYKIF